MFRKTITVGETMALRTTTVGEITYLRTTTVGETTYRRTTMVGETMALRTTTVGEKAGEPFVIFPFSVNWSSYILNFKFSDKIYKVKLVMDIILYI